MSPRLSADMPARPYEVAIVGNDAILAALPARPMQLAHAILACGYDLVVPVSWGEEVVAEHALRAISARDGAPAIFCACPTLRARLLAAGSELAPFLLSLVAPSVATARYLRALQPEVPLRITLIGGCPDSVDPSIDIRVAPHDFLHLLANRGITLDRQPAVFDSVVPPDRRRYYSLPGGCPAPRALESRAPDCRLVTITEEGFPAELAEYLLGSERVLIDLSPRLGCACCGGFGDREHRGLSGREEILRHEPPRSPTPILDHDVVVSVGAEPLRLPSPSTDHPREERARAVAGESLREATARVRLPGTVPIESARVSKGKRHIAVTPPGAMAAVPVPPRASGYWEPAPIPGWHAAGAVRELPRDVRPVPASGTVPARTTSTSPVIPIPLVVEPGARHEGTSAARSHPPAATPAVPPEASPRAQRPTPIPYVFRLSRATSHPRASTGGGQVLPRAYVARRYTPPAERIVELAVEPPLALKPPIALAGQALAPETESYPADRIADDSRSTGILERESATTAAGEQMEAAPASSDSAVSETALLETEAVETEVVDLERAATPAAQTAAINAEVLARIRQQARRPGRVVSRDMAPSREPREPGRILVAITTAVLALALIVALAIIFRRAPTAPW